MRTTLAYTFIHFVCLTTITCITVPSVTEELLAQLVIRKFIKNEYDFRKYQPYDVALVKDPAPILVRTAFHLNTDKADGCLDQTALPFNKGLANITDHIGGSYELYSRLHRVVQEVYEKRSEPEIYDFYAQAAESVCKRRSISNNKCHKDCETLEQQKTAYCHGQLHLWNKSGWKSLMKNLGDLDFWTRAAYHIVDQGSSTAYENRVVKLAELIQGFYNNVYLSLAGDQWQGQKLPSINQADFTAMVFVEALYDAMPEYYVPHCQGMKAKGVANYQVNINDKKISDCYEQGVEKRNQEFLVTFEREMPAYAAYTYGRRFSGDCRSEDSCACPLGEKYGIDSLPHESYLLDENYARTAALYDGLTIENLVVLLGAHGFGGMHSKVSGHTTSTWVPYVESGKKKLENTFLHRMTKPTYNWKQKRVVDGTDDSKYIYEFRRTVKSKSETRDICSQTLACYSNGHSEEDFAYHFDASLADEIDDFSKNGQPMTGKNCNQIPNGYKYKIPDKVCSGMATDDVVSTFSWKPKANFPEPFNISETSFPLDVSMSKNLSRNDLTGEIWSPETNQAVEIVRDEFYRDDTFPAVTGKYFNQRLYDFEDSTHSRTGCPYSQLAKKNGQEFDVYHRTQNFSAEFQFDFWENYEKMIRNGYEGDFSGDPGKDRLVSTFENNDVRRDLCMKAFLVLTGEGEVKEVDDGDIDFYCRRAANKDRTWYDDRGVLQERFTSDYIDELERTL